MLGLTLLLCSPVFAQDATTAKIAALQESIAGTKAKKIEIHQALARTERQIGLISKKLPTTHQAYRQQTKTFAALVAQRQFYEAALEKERADLREQIFIAYLLSRQPSLKLWLNQQNPADIDRYLYDDRILSQVHLQSLKNFQRLSEALTATIQAQEQEGVALASTKQALEQEKAALKAEQAARYRILRVLDRSIHTDEQRLAILLKDKARLKKVIETHRSSPAVMVAQDNYFQDQAHRLPWPLRGHLVQAFHTPLLGGRILSNGWLIAAPLGTPIHAVYGGQVVFANWLRGFGFLVIIQNGKDYLTLYAHAQSLYVSEGDHVNQGELIATAGDSGGNTTPGVYFEIRDDGEPVDPKHWLKA